METGPMARNAMAAYQQKSASTSIRLGAIVRRLVVLALLVGPAAAAVTIESGWWQHRLEPTIRLLADPDPRVYYASDSTRERRIALTIDDGPDARTTPVILDALRRHDARATFFLISGRVEGNGPVVDRMVAEGHEIANHMTADRASIDLAPALFDSRLKHAHDTLSRWQVPAWFRPGSGWYDEAMIEAVERQGYRMALGRIYPLDAAVAAPDLAARYILWRAEPGEIIILHDAGWRGRNTARTLERILPVLERRGFQVVTLSELEGSGGGVE